MLFCFIKSLQQTSISRESESISVERPVRLQRSGSLSSLNDELHSNDTVKRKMTVLETGASSSMIVEDTHLLKKLHDDSIRITINYINNHLYEYFIPKTNLILLPREVRRHHVNNCWLADEQILYQIKSSYESISLIKAQDILSKLTYEYDDSTKNRHRRYTDGNRQSLRKSKDLHILTTCQDDLHIRPLGSISKIN